MEGQNLISALRPGPECPSIERLGRYADGALTSEERSRDEPHITACPNCQAELALLQAFATPAVRDDEAKVVRWGVEELRRREPEIFESGSPQDSNIRRWSWIGRLRPASTLAIVLLLLGSGYYFSNQETPGLPADIGSSPEATRSLTVTVRAPIGDQTSVPARLQWEPVTGAARYRVRVSEVDRQEIWSGDAVRAEIDLPPDVRARIVPGKTLVWQVTAYGAPNAAIAESAAQQFRLVR
jgi:hypothetical protein